MVSELSIDNAAEWLARYEFPSSDFHFTELGGGISNKVVLAEAPGFRVVLKQSLSQLRTDLGWHSDRKRIFRESAAMRWIGGKAWNSRAQSGNIPRVLFTDDATFTIAMEGAPPGAEMWKSRLLRGDLDPGLARTVGLTLGSIISASWYDSDAERLFGDQTIFDQLRIDPYYRYTATRRLEASEYIHSLIDRSAARQVSLVHGDWSPKNLLVDKEQLWVIDWEVVHFGDPSFDVGFLLNHLLLKSIAMPRLRGGLMDLAHEFLEGLFAELPSDAGWILPAAMEHLPALLLARVYGKSPVEYLDIDMRQRVTSLATDLMRYPPSSVREVFTR